MVKDRLRHLEARGPISRQVISTEPVAVAVAVAVVYQIAQLGQTAIAYLDALRIWCEALPPAAHLPASRDEG